LYNGSGVELYDAASNTIYKAQLPAPPASTGGAEAPPSLSAIQNALDKLAGTFTLSGATPTTVAGQGAYQLRLTPSSNGGLVGAAEIAWDATHGIPLRLALYAVGDTTPVLELTATQITYGPVAASDVQINFPSDAHVVDLGAPGSGASGTAGSAPVTGVAAVSAQLSFPLVAPAALGGQSRSEVRLVHMDGSPAALVTYGQGLGSLAVLEAQQSARAGNGGLTSSLPTVSVASGVSATELPTALGTVLRFDKAGVSFTLAASQSASAVVGEARRIAG
jgi:hypothetical protein